MYPIQVWADWTGKAHESLDRLIDEPRIREKKIIPRSVGQRERWNFLSVELENNHNVNRKPNYQRFIWFCWYFEETTSLHFVPFVSFHTTEHKNQSNASCYSWWIMSMRDAIIRNFLLSPSTVWCLQSFRRHPYEHLWCVLCFVLQLFHLFCLLWWPEIPMHRHWKKKKPKK